MLYLIDSSAVLNDFGFEFVPENSYLTTPLVMAEFRDMRSRNLAENSLQRGFLKIEDPGNESLHKVGCAIAEKGFTRLSKPDISLLALALDLKSQNREFILVSDDYSIQNFCSVLKIPFESAIRGKIEKEISFRLYCPGCGKGFPANSTERKCPVCGFALKRQKAQ